MPSHQARFSRFWFCVFILVGAVLVPQERAEAIVDIESLRMKLHDSPYGGLVTFSWNRKQGNSDTNELATSLQGLWKHDKLEYLAAASREFGESNGARDTNRTVGHLRLTWPTDRTVEGEAFTQIEQDQFRRLSDRELIGSGARVALSQKKDFLAYAGAGLMLSQETVSYLAGTTDSGSGTSFRGDFYLSGRVEVAPNVALSTAAYFQPSMTTLTNYWVYDSSELAFEANASMSLALAYHLIYESLPPQTVQQTDQTFGSVLKYKF